MSIKSMILALAVGWLSVGCVAEGGPAEEPTGTVTSYSHNHNRFHCHNIEQNGVVNVNCLGGISIFDIDVDVGDVEVLNNNELNILSHNLNKLAINLKDVVDVNVVLKKVEVLVLKIFNNDLDIDIEVEDILVCALAVIQVCK